MSKFFLEINFLELVFVFSEFSDTHANLSLIVFGDFFLSKLKIYLREKYIKIGKLF